jgi:hypothetical protein
MDEPEIDAVPVRVESNAPYPPGMIESQEFREEGDVAHCWGARERGLSRKGIGVSAILGPEQSPYRFGGVADEIGRCRSQNSPTIRAIRSREHTC